MGQVIYFDCFSGAAGDMVLAALLDAGLPADALGAALGSLGVGHELAITRVMRAGIAATHFDVRDAAAQAAAGQHHGDHGHPHRRHHGPQRHHHHEHGHGHDHHHHGGHAHDEDPAASHHHHGHAHRTLDDIAQLVAQSALSSDGKQRAMAMFRRIAEAEAAIHDVPVDQVHLHEVGALDSIIDVVGAVFAMEWFGIDDVVASPLNLGAGTVTMAHGTFPVPAPATLRLLAGVPVYSSGTQAELVTPTGALVVTTYAREYGALPPMRVRRVGYGAGTRDLGAAPNVLRVVIGERLDARTEAPADAVVQIECEIDDMNPQLFGPVSDRLFDAGALDVFLTPVQMKKGRPGTLLTVLAPPAQREAICDLIFRETTTLGVRFADVRRETLDRSMETVDLSGGPVRIKIAGRRGEVLNAVPEFDDCVRIARATGRPVKQVQADALRAWLDRGSH
jgi:uncharacterized protein (TIGR00299 family) protein